MFSKKHEKYFSKELEKFKKNLLEDLYRFKTRYSFFYRKQAEAILELYKRVYRMINAAVELLKPKQLDSNLSEKKKLIERYYNEALTFFNENKLLFNEGIIEITKSNLEIVNNSVLQFNTALMFTGTEKESYRNTEKEEWINAWKKLEDNLPSVIKEFEKALKEVITV
ncbi:hypothetical protein [Rosettibacter firmus]|uniref:hypothetical protein n=1 Tax=Rosettibacter firmus TaxID=3111522 RepID=UPI003EBD56DF